MWDRKTEFNKEIGILKESIGNTRGTNFNKSNKSHSRTPHQ